MKKVWIVWMVVLVVLLTACAPTIAQPSEDKLQVAVGIVPEAAFVQEVAGDHADVVTMIPTGYSPANYSPTAQEMRALSDADVYFTLRMPAEQANILPKVDDFNEDIRIVDLREAAAAQYPLRTLNGHSHEQHEEDHIEAAHDEDTVDPHIWLSPKRAAVMVQAIADTLSELDAANEDTYQQNAAQYIAEIEALDEQISQSTASAERKIFLIYHPSYGYFADDYGFEMLTIETAGKAATAAEIGEVIDMAKQNGITTVFYQSEFDDTQAEAVAAEIGGTVHKAQPLSPNYIEALQAFAQALTQ